MGLSGLRACVISLLLGGTFVTCLSHADPHEQIYAPPLIVCIVPSDNVGQVTVRLRLFVSTTTQEVMAILSENGIVTVFRPQGSIQDLVRDLNEGRFSGVLLKDSSGIDNGILTQAGFVSINLIQGKTFEGFLAANNSVYPLSCIRHQ